MRAEVQDKALGERCAASIAAAAGSLQRDETTTPRLDGCAAGRFCNEVPATAYSPALSRAEYHRRCRA